VLGEVRRALTLVPDDHELIVTTVSSRCKDFERADRVIE
jgi:hypothetical protein